MQRPSHSGGSVTIHPYNMLDWTIGVIEISNYEVVCRDSPIVSLTVIVSLDSLTAICTSPGCAGNSSGVTAEALLIRTSNRYFYS